MKWTASLWLFLLFGLAFTSCKKHSDGIDDSSVTEIPSSAADGVTFINDGSSAIFNLYAPGKTSVAVIGDFNDWKPTAMKQTADGKRWWVQIDNLDPSKEYAYQYSIDGSIKVADPYTRKVLDPDNDPYITAATYPNLKSYPSGKTSGIVSTMQYKQDQYVWKNTAFTRPDKNKLVIYEMLVRDFVAAHNYKTVTDTLNYLSNLGVNAIELLPVNEFEGNESWGYNTNFGFALDKYYGTENDYKAFIDSCHGRGIAVIQDIVLEDQFGSSPMVRMYANSSGTPTNDNPWFNSENLHPYAVGYQLNHESSATKYYTKNVIKYWMTEFHIDGFRFDQAKAFTQRKSTTDADWSAYDATRVAIWKDYYSYMKSLDPSFYVILEYFGSNQEESELAREGMMCWTNLNYNANQATMGWNTDWNFQGIFYDQHSFPESAGLVAYFESHDEERLMYKNEQWGNSSGSYNVKDIPTGLKRLELATAFLLSAPGPKMFWQFGELGYDIPIDQNGRTGNKPILWNYNNDTNRRNLYKAYSRLIRWKIKNDIFNTSVYRYSMGGAIKTIQLSGDNQYLELVGNFDVVNQTASISFPTTGTWYDNSSGTTIQVGSSPYSMTLAPGEYRLYTTSPLK